MVAAAERTGNALIEAFHYRFHRAMLRALDVARNSLGRLVCGKFVFEVRIPYAPTELRWLAEQGGGALMDLGCYPIHAARTLTGEEPSVRNARSIMDRGVDAVTEAELEFPSGLTATIRCSMMPSSLALGFRISGERGSLSVSNYIGPQFGCELKTNIDGTERIEVVGGPSSYDAQLEHVVRVLRGEEAAVTGGNDAIANMLVIEQIRDLAAQR
jgi:predicted dehydrogenase